MHFHVHHRKPSHSAHRYLAIACLAIFFGLQTRADDVVSWGRTLGEPLPDGLNRIVGVAAGYYHTLALTAYGNVIPWGYVPDGFEDAILSASDIISVSAQLYSSVALTKSGQVLSWGASITNQPPGLSNVVAVVNGGSHVLALTADGQVTSWGWPGRPIPPDGLSDVVAIAAGWSHSLALVAGGRVIAWGENIYGQLDVPLAATNVIAIAAGGNHNLAIRLDGTVIAWGQNSYGQSDVPAGLSNVVAVAASWGHSLALTANGSVVGWGKGANGEANYPGYGEATPPPGLSNVVAIATGMDFSIALVGSSPGAAAPEFISAQPWRAVVDSVFYQRLVVKNGANGFSATGLPAGLQLDSTRGIVTGVPESPGEFPITLFATNAVGVTTQSIMLHVNLPIPTLGTDLIVLGIGVPTQQPIVNYSSGVQFAAESVPPGLALDGVTGVLHGMPILEGDFPMSVTVSNRHGTATGTVLVRVSPVVAWGENEFGQRIPPAGLSNVVALAAGARHSLALDNRGNVTAWGNNEYGQASVLPGLSNVVAIAAGYYHNLALTDDGRVIAWGAGQTNGLWPNFSQSRVPDGLSNVVAIAAAGNQSMVLTAEGQIFTRGSVDNGDGYSLASVPPGLSAVVGIGAGFAESIAILGDGLIVPWDDRASGFPEDMPAVLTNLVAVAADQEDLALRADGRVLAWQPWRIEEAAEVPGVSNAVAVSAGYAHRVVLSRDGRITSWGQLPANPNAVPAILTNALAVASGEYHSLALVHLADESAPPEWIGPRHWMAMVDFPFHQFLRVKHVVRGYAADGLPPGLVLDPVVCKITGVPEQAGEFAVTLFATNAAGVGTMSVKLHVNIPQPLIRNRPLTVLGLGLPTGYRIHSHYATTLHAVGLPPGLVLDSQTGIMSGVPHAEGEFPVTLVASNRHGTTSSNVLLRVTSVVGSSAYAFQTIPAGVRDAVAVAGGYDHHLAAVEGGGVFGWGGYDYHGKTTPPPGLSNVVALAAGYAHSLALTADGHVVGWGAGGPGTSGYPNFGQTTIPSGLSNVVTIAAGYEHSLALRTDGEVFAWGRNYYGQATVPVGLTRVIAISAGAYHNLAVTADGRVTQWGYGDPAVPPVPAGLGNVVAVAAGWYHSLALLADGQVISWGNEAEAPRGLSNVVSIAAGNGYSVAVTRDGEVHSWGNQLPGPISPPTNRVNVLAMEGAYNDYLAIVGLPVGVSAPQLLTPPTLIATEDERFSYRVIARNEVTAFGISGLPTGLWFDSVQGVINGTPVISGKFTITLFVTNTLGVTARQVTLSVNPPAQPFILNAGLVVLGQGLPVHYPIISYYTPWLEVIGLPPGLSFDPLTQIVTGVPTTAGDYPVSLMASNRHGATANSLALRVTPVLAWGNNSHGQTNVPPGLGSVVAVAAGIDHSMALTADGRVISWGGYYFVPSTPNGLSNLVALSAGLYHNLGLHADGTVSAWGVNNYDQIRLPAGLTNIVAVAAGHYHSLALTASGKVLAWGSNLGGEGVVPEGLSNVVTIAAGAYHNLALTSRGEVVSWGRYWDGYIFTPATSVGELDNVTTVAAGTSHDLALFSDGHVWAWGRGYYQTLVPTGLTNVISIASKWGRAVALTAEGRIAAWGTSNPGERNRLNLMSNVVAMAAGGTHTLVLLGNPASLTDSFIVTPTRGPEGFLVSIPTDIGRTYAIERKLTLGDQGWLFVGNVLGDGATKLFIDPAGTSTAFYRIRQMPRN